jgi:hypothetical protein
MKIRILIVLIFFIVMVTGCKSTGVIPISQDSYMIGKKDNSPGVGISLENKATVYQEANTFCTQKGKEVSVLREDVIAAAPGRLGSTEIQFRCVEAGGSATRVEKDSDREINLNIENVKSEENEDYYLELQKLKSLLVAGILTKEEFERTKAAILSKF